MGSLGNRRVQALKKVTPGTPVDNQIATYLTDFDTFVTADRGFAECVEALRSFSPCRLASTAVRLRDRQPLMR